MTDVSLEISGDASSVEFFLDRINTALNPVALVEFLTGQVVPWLNARGAERFRGEGDDVVGKWQPLQMSTQLERIRGKQQGLWDIGPDHPINVRTHELEDYITHSLGYTLPSSLGATLTYPDPKDANASIKEKMKTAQQGRTSPSTVPRPVLGINERDLAYVLQRLATHVMGKEVPV